MQQQCCRRAATTVASSARTAVALDRVLNQYSKRHSFFVLSPCIAPIVDRGQFGRGAKAVLPDLVDKYAPESSSRTRTLTLTLLSMLEGVFPDIPANSWPARMRWGGLFIDGKPQIDEVVLGKPLKVPCRVEYYVPKVPFERAHTLYPSFRDEFVLYEDEHLLAAFKPSCLSTTPPKEQRHCALRPYIVRYLNRKSGEPEAKSSAEPNTKVISVHMPSRLDWSTCGLVLMSINPSTHASLQRLFHERRIVKTYVFQATGKCSALRAPGDEVEVCRAIGKHPAHPVLFRVRPRDDRSATDEEHSLPPESSSYVGSSRSRHDRKRARVACPWKEASTTLTLLGRSSVIDEHGAQVPTLLVRAVPHTGRTHQIRLHATCVGLTIVNDEFYDGILTECVRLSPDHTNRDDLHLMAESVQFVHPATGNTVHITVPKKLRPLWCCDLPHDSSHHAADVNVKCM